MKKGCNNAGKAGFTLMEILTVIGIAVFLLALTLGIAGYARFAAREGRALADMEKIAFVLQDYWLRNGSYPSTLVSVSNRLPENFSFSNAVPLDPWGRNYYYSNAPQSYLLKSFGPDGRTSGDDILSGR